MAGAWMGFMMIVLGLWAVWLNQDSELRHKKSAERARMSLFIVIAIDIISLVVFVTIQVNMKGGA